MLTIEDLVSGEWLSHLVPVEEPQTRVENRSPLRWRPKGYWGQRWTGRVDSDAVVALTPILGAVTGNGSKRSPVTPPTFMTLLPIAHHVG